MAYGTVSADVIQSSVANTSLGAGNASIMKNRIINGAMVIDQRNAGASYSTSTLASANFYCLDRYLVTGTQNSKFTIQQNAGSVTPPAGFNNYLGVTSSSAYSVASGDLFAIIQRIEAFNTADLGWGTANAKTITISFQVYSSLTGTFGGSLRNNNNNRSYPFSYTVSSANTWTSISITIAGDTSGTWEGATNNTGIQVGFNLGTGSTYSGTAGAWAGANYYAPTGATSVVGTNGATFYITGVQLEVGSSATGYEYRQYTQELSLCQRYYTKFANNSSTTSATFASGNIVSSTDARVSATFPTTMRTSPTINYSLVRLFDGNSASAINSITQNQATTTVFGAQFGASAASFTIGRGANIVQNAGDTTSYIDASAEL